MNDEPISQLDRQIQELINNKADAKDLKIALLEQYKQGHKDGRDQAYKIIGLFFMCIIAVATLLNFLF